MTWLAFAFALELGIVPTSGFMMYERQPEVFYYEGVYYYPVSVTTQDFGPMVYTQLDARLVLADWFFLGGGVRVQTQYHDGAWSFSPQATFYEFVGGVERGRIRVQYKHACLHPQMAYMFNYRPASGWEGSYDEVSVRLSHGY